MSWHLSSYYTMVHVGLGQPLVPKRSPCGLSSNQTTMKKHVSLLSLEAVGGFCSLADWWLCHYVCFLLGWADVYTSKCVYYVFGQQHIIYIYFLVYMSGQYSTVCGWFCLIWIILISFDLMWRLNTLIWHSVVKIGFGVPHFGCLWLSLCGYDD